MKFLVVFALALATASAIDLKSTDIQSRSLVVPVAEPEGRITNGQNAAVGQFPYQVGLSLKLNDNSYSWCGGSVISNEWVLTAAHCTYGIQGVTVYLGATVRSQPQLMYNVSPRNVIIHSGYDKDSLLNDISLIRIPYTTYTAKIQPVQLPRIASSYPTYTGNMAVASGWGLISDSPNSVTNDLQWARMEVITNSVCARTFGNMVQPSNICVSTAGGVSTCSGDSGGPLVLDYSRVQIGLTSYGIIKGCTRGQPAAFTRITSYLDWIQYFTGIPL